MSAGNILEPGLAFLEGLALIASPCILPVLPLILSASADGGKRRPFGIITGFVLSFSLFAFASRKIVAAFSFDLDVLRDVSLVLLFFFGLVLLSSRLSEKFSQWTQGLANWSNKLTAAGKEGYGSGVLIGALIGLVWTPCAGPILAAVLVQVIRQQTDLAGYFIILSFSIGAGIPMLAIALAGRTVMSRLGFLTKHTETLRKAFGVIIIASVLFIASGVDIESLLPGKKAVQQHTGALQLENVLDTPYPAPEFSDIEAWLNSPPLTMAGLKGKVVLVDFWTYSCINCVRTLPYITEWDRKYRDKGLVIVGVHAPEFQFEKKRENVMAAIAAHKIKYPVALDNNLSTWEKFKNRYWPAHYLIDRGGNVFYTHFGEGHYDITENNIRFALGMRDWATAQPETEVPAAEKTPETYLGYGRSGTSFIGRDLLVHDKEISYSFPENIPNDNWALNGKWNIGHEKIVSGEKGAALRLNFTGKKVFLVLGTATGQPVHVSIHLNGKAKRKLIITRHTLYELISQKKGKRGLLEIQADTPGLEAYAFTFG